MPAKKIAISISNEALAIVDEDAAKEGISRSAWFERAVHQAKRRQAVRRSLTLARRHGVKPATERELDRLRRELSGVR